MHLKRDDGNVTKVDGLVLIVTYVKRRDEAKAKNEVDTMLVKEVHGIEREKVVNVVHIVNGESFLLERRVHERRTA